jgi:hypothetical protein
VTPGEVLAKGANHAARVGLGHATTVRSNALRVGDECKEAVRSLRGAPAPRPNARFSSIVTCVTHG